MSARDSGWEVVVGLEVHAELATNSKLFCGSPNTFGSEPNTNICPTCLGLPGSLPVLNERAIELAIRIGAALGSETRPSIFHRKNYFYPDMPKDYQISQYDEPINVGGSVTLPDGSVVGIVRAHIEEDTGKTTHVGGTGRIHTASYALVDYNRAGVPLVEIVSEPDIRSAEQARAYVTELRAILVATGASDGRMEEGSLRVDANVSVRRVGERTYGTRCEVKNLNSLRSLARAIEFEFERQIAIIEEGGAVAQETRHFNEDDGTTSPLRSKEEAFDYRYFADRSSRRTAPSSPPTRWRPSSRSASTISSPMRSASERTRGSPSHGRRTRRQRNRRRRGSSTWLPMPNWSDSRRAERFPRRR
jgi:aspartyl-tRNA(Asn)/glutamyl-tRNA(Gln) amidotransferase subunit B